VWLSLHQDDDRVVHGQPYTDISFILLRCEQDGSLVFEKAAVGTWRRDTHLHLPMLGAGTYRVVPISSGQVTLPARNPTPFSPPSRSFLHLELQALHGHVIPTAPAGQG
jgi:SET domain-containing protein 6